MSDRGTRREGGLDSPAALRRLHEERVRAELAAADRLAPGSDRVAWRGDPLACVAVVKGLPGPAEAAGGAAVSGADGDAVEKGLAKLGHEVAHLFFTLSRPEPSSGEDARCARLRMQIEAVDPALVIALDRVAAQDVAAAFGIDPPAFGVSCRAGGRAMVAVDGLEASLDDDARKREIWRQLSAAKPQGPVF